VILTQYSPEVKLFTSLVVALKVGSPILVQEKKIFAPVKPSNLILLVASGEFVIVPLIEIVGEVVQQPTVNLNVFGQPP
jgi:hypothetical protein